MCRVACMLLIIAFLQKVLLIIAFLQKVNRDLQMHILCLYIENETSAKSCSDKWISCYENGTKIGTFTKPSPDPQW